MNEIVEIKYFNLQPAKVETNLNEVAKYLDEILKNYSGMVFTDESIPECKTTLADLNKRKKELEDFGKNVEKELTKEVKEFRSEVKELSKKFDEVIEPIKAQYDAFENDRRNKKSQQVQIWIDEIIYSEGLNEKYAQELTILDKYLNKTAKDKDTKDDLMIRAVVLGNQQDKEEQDKELIESFVEVQNLKTKQFIKPEPYFNLIGLKVISEIKEIILKDIETNKDAEPKSELSKEILFEKYKVEGTESQLNRLEEYMSSMGLAWSVIE